MVAALLRLRFRVLGNTLRRDPLQLLAVIAGALPVLGMLLLALAGLVASAFQPPAATQTAIVIGGSVVVVGWVVVPLLIDGIEQTLDPSRLRRFPIRPRQLMAAVLVADLAGAPGAATLLAALGTALAWVGHPAAAIAAIGAGLLATLTCLAASHVATEVAGMLLRGRRAARVVVAIVLLLLIGGPFAAAVAASGRGGAVLHTHVAPLLEVLGWTPLGAAWSVPGRIALGDGTGALLASAVALGTAGLLLVLWRSLIRSTARVRGERRERSTGRSRLGPLGALPTGAAGAVAGRALVYWFRDPRRTRQLVLVPVVPLVLLLYARLLGVEGVALAAGPVGATLLPLASFADVSYDGTAFTAEVAAGVRGAADRIGRAAALLTIGLPTAVVVQLVVTLVLGRTDALPPLLGLSIGLLLISTGVVGVSSARVVIPVARAGHNPFAAPAGAATMSIAASYAVLGITIAIASPAIALTIAALVTGSATLGWIALVVGLLLGVGAFVAGMLVGGRVLDARAPEVLARLHLIRG